ncbi:hypothetical protein STRTUCAR8_00873 [Streptomyces turgidiscabies Car8]|uniref:Uncharacterized protein n=1 Tax=Streptomyces turgidiscabies (strain Car8) TaxID=698760 RepID=L7FEH2_STRT8|nr:hypothetical protein STRTUCAR8_00873 [Streptomyces turgidiscabies Car8]
MAVRIPPGGACGGAGSSAEPGRGWRSRSRGGHGGARPPAGVPLFRPPGDAQENSSPRSEKTRARAPGRRHPPAAFGGTHTSRTPPRTPVAVPRTRLHRDANPLLRAMPARPTARASPPLANRPQQGLV